MIITCNNCNKNFDIDSSLIPENGRLLQCNSCDHKWFFKKEITDKPIPVVKIKDLTEETKLFKEEMVSFEEENVLVETESSKTIELLDKTTQGTSIIKKISTAEKNEFKEDDDELKIEISKNEKNNNILGLIIVFIISFIAIIIVLDTFQKPISYIVPNIEFLLYSLYETINDIVLFFSDLI